MDDHDLIRGLILWALITLFLIIFAGFARAEVPAPQSIVIVACRVDDLTGQPGRHDPTLAAKDWRDLELHINNNQEYECKREVLDLTDAQAFGDMTPREMVQIVPDFGDWGQGARVCMMQAADYNRKNPGWGVVACGLPTKIVNEKGEAVGWQMPSCPTYLPGTNNRMRCVYDESVI